MYKKQLFYTTIISTMLTLLLLAAFFAFGGFALAQDGGEEPSDGLVETGTDAGDLTSDGLSDPAEQSAPIAFEPSLTDAPNMSHWWALGTHLRPRTSNLTYTYDFYGCSHVTGGTGNRLMFPVNLPDGAMIKSMDVYYDDTSNSDLIVWLSRYLPGGNNIDLLSVSSTGNGGSGTASSSEISHVVDNSQRAYSLIYSWSGVTDGSLQICGIRINYIDPFHSSFLPNVAK